MDGKTECLDKRSQRSGRSQNLQGYTVRVCTKIKHKTFVDAKKHAELINSDKTPYLCKQCDNYHV